MCVAVKGFGLDWLELEPNRGRKIVDPNNCGLFFFFFLAAQYHGSGAWFTGHDTRTESRYKHMMSWDIGWVRLVGFLGPSPITLYSIHNTSTSGPKLADDRSYTSTTVG